MGSIVFKHTRIVKFEKCKFYQGWIHLIKDNGLILTNELPVVKKEDLLLSDFDMYTNQKESSFSICFLKRAMQINRTYTILANCKLPISYILEFKKTQKNDWH